MKRAVVVAALLAIVGGAAWADSSDLSDGVLIVHCPPGLAYTSTPTDWAEAYRSHAIHACSEQVNRVDTKTGVVWYVISAWSDSNKVFCGVEFGLGAYEPSSWAMTAFGPCGTPTMPLEIPKEGWPGPNLGTSLAAQGDFWSGNFVPVYYFAGYAYYPGVIPIAPHPSGFVGWANCGTATTAPQSYFAVCRGALGLFQDGRACCPPPPPVTVCCLGAECHLMTADACRAKGGLVLPGLEACGEPNPCGVLRSTIWDTIRTIYR